VASPATAPLATPSTVGFPRCIHSTPIHTRAAVDAAAWVAKKALPPPTHVVEWRTFAKYRISWAKPWPVAWNLEAVPWWAWIGCLCGYTLAAGLLMRKRQTFAIETIADQDIVSVTMAPDDREVPLGGRYQGPRVLVSA